MTSHKNSLPIPSEEALSHSAQLIEYLKTYIQSKSGWISFAEWMQGVLYAPGLGYYAAGAAKFGNSGDFITAPEISPLFGRTVARWIARNWGSIEDWVILEPGAGTGRLAASILEELQKQNVLPSRYLILEPSPSLQQTQRDHLSQSIPELIHLVEWIEVLPDTIRGIVIANEVLDAMPVHLMVTTDHNGVFWERGVSLSESTQDPKNSQHSEADLPSDFVWKACPASVQMQEWATQHLPNDNALEPATVFELGLPAEAWCRLLTDRLEYGQVILIDYGFPAREFYHPQRRNGTLMCHYRHHAHDDPFLYPGLQDITAHVDFTSIARALSQGGLNLDQYQTQAGFLLANGILETLSPGLEPGSVAWLKETTALQKLLSPAEMGELFKVLVASRGLSDPQSSHANSDVARQQLGL